MPNLYTVPASAPIARHAAAHLLATIATEALANAVLLVPTRRSCVIMRHAFQQELNGKAALLPRILPLADSENLLVNLLGDQALPILATIPPAMSDAQQRYLLAQQIMAFEKHRGGVTLHYAFALADALMALQEQCARAGVTITQEKLRQLLHSDVATHWKEALLFLGILTDSWPAIERELRLTTTATREVALMNALSDHWQNHPPAISITALGSTGSQPSTARLLKTIADLPTGQVILPGLDPTITEQEWAMIDGGHPLAHIKSLLDQWPVTASEVVSLKSETRSVWLDALAPAAAMPEWKNQPLPPYNHIHLIPCAHSEEEARVISLLLREALEHPTHRVALITPDENLMARVASHMQRYDITIDKLNAGTLATTETGSLWAALAAVLTNPESLLSLRHLLHHPLLNIDETLLVGLENGWYGANRRRAGQLPRHEAGLTQHPDYTALSQFVSQLTQLSRQRHHASTWVSQLNDLLKLFLKTRGQGHKAVGDQLETLTLADDFGAMDSDDFSTALNERLSDKWRDAGLNTQPRIAMLTPVEARLEQFDRIILANLQEATWPGIQSPNPWLNLAAQQALGLPGAPENISRMAHDMLIFGSAPEVFLTYPQRDGGSPTTRSRFIERLVTLLAAHGISEAAITAHHYIDWADAREASATYEPEKEIAPAPPTEQRPRRLPVTDLDKLFTDPFAIYAKHVLNLRPLKEIDASLEASDFGSLAHKAIEALSTHWDNTNRPATSAELDHITHHALREFSQRPNVDFFWRARLRNGLSYVNKLETERRSNLVSVAAEQSVEEKLTLNANETISLYGRIDRIERRAGGLTIIDHKTGNAPKEKEILDGKALQLLAYSMLLNEPLEAIEYWALPKLGEEGEITHLDTTPQFAEIETKLRGALIQMLDEKTPFLATGGNDHFGDDYAGINRYDEWAG